MFKSAVRYFIPEDGDNELQPNIFLAPKSRQPGHPPTLGQIKQAFPLLGRYHYRFKTSIGGNNSNDTHNNTKHHLAVWMDCIDDQMPVPVWQSQIVAKITRIGVEEEEEDDDDDEDFRRPTASQPTSANVAVGVPLSRAPSQPPQQQQQQPPRPAPPPPQQHPSAPSFDLFGDGPSVPATTNNTTTTHQPHNMSANLFDTAPVPASTTSSSLFDMSYQPTTGTHHNTSTSSSSNHTSMHHSDFLGMTTAPSPPVSGNYGGYAPQQQQQPRSTSNNSSSAFGTSNSSNNSGGAFGDLAWK